MNTFEQDMKAAYKKLEKDMGFIASLFPNVKRKGYLGENIMLLDFNSKHFNTSCKISSENFIKNGAHPGWFSHNHKSIEFRMVTYPKINRIAFTF